MAEIQLNYTAEDINKYLKTASDIDNIIDSLLSEKLSELTQEISELKTQFTQSNILQIIRTNRFRGNYTPTGVYSISGNKVSVLYGVEELQTKNIMNDFARFLGSLHEYGIKTITYNETAYTWDENKGLQGSNFVDAEGNTLVSAAVNTFVISGVGTYEGNMFLDTVEITYSITIQK